MAATMVALMTHDATAEEFLALGEPLDAFRMQPKFELRCSSCGYGVVVRIAPESCPMCRGSLWESPRMGLARAALQAL